MLRTAGSTRNLANYIVADRLEGTLGGIKRDRPQLGLNSELLRSHEMHYILFKGSTVSDRCKVHHVPVSNMCCSPKPEYSGSAHSLSFAMSDH